MSTLGLDGRSPGARRLLVAAALVAALVSACTSGGDGDSPGTPGGTGAASASSGTPTPASTSTGQAAGQDGGSPTTSGADSTTLQLTVAAGGDVLLHPTTWQQADKDAGTAGDGRYDFAPQLSAIKPVIAAADLGICHMETPVAERKGPFVGYPSFSVPPQIAKALAAIGFDACSQASNHSFDRGLAGARRTVEALQAAGITPYGVAAEAHPANPSVITVRAKSTDGSRSADVKVGLLSYTYGFNGAVPAGGGEIVEVVSAKQVRRDAATARELGAKIVIASIHWGTEYRHEPDALQRTLTPKLAAIDNLDLVLGHHAHVVQPIARVTPSRPVPAKPDGTWVVYGMGNLIATQATSFPPNHEGILSAFTFEPRDRTGERWKVTRAAYQATLIERSQGVRVVLLPQAREDAPAALRARYAAAERRTRQVVTSLDAPVVQLGRR